MPLPLLLAPLAAKATQALASTTAKLIMIVIAIGLLISVIWAFSYYRKEAVENKTKLEFAESKVEEMKIAKDFTEQQFTTILQENNRLHNSYQVVIKNAKITKQQNLQTPPDIKEAERVINCIFNDEPSCNVKK